MTQVLPFFTEKFVDDSDSMIVGTGQQEWIVGPDAIKKLVENDWKEWQDLTIDIENAHIHREGNIAWVTTKATCMITYTMEQISEFFMNMIKSTLGNPEQTKTEKLVWVNQISSRLLYEEKQGNTLKFALRLSIVLVKRSDKWKIHQMHFSFPNVLFPDGRIKE
jgi:ketosteroid isomerase-like protein